MKNSTGPNHHHCLNLMHRFNFAARNATSAWFWNCSRHFKLTTRKSTAFVFILTFSLTGTSQAVADEPEHFVLVGVTVVNTRDGTLLRNMQVEVDAGKIVRVAPGKPVLAAKDAVRIKARGKYLVPGYNDMHAHPFSGPMSPELSMPLYVANGVTGVRVMISPIVALEQRRKGSLPLPSVTPEILQMAGPPLDGSVAPTPDAARAAVNWHKALGAEMIKIVDVGPVVIGPEAYLAAIDEAHRLGLPVGGHYPPAMDPELAIAHGMDTIEHLGDSLLLSCSNQEEALRAEYAALPQVYRNMGHDVHLTPTLALTPEAVAFIGKLADSYDESKCVAFAKHLADTGLWQTPTLIRSETMYVLDEPALWDQPGFRYLPAPVLARWRNLIPVYQALAPETRACLKALFEVKMRFAKVLADNDAKLVLGSDMGPAAWLVAGFSLHQEFGLLKQAGFSSLKILQMATLNAAIQLGREADMGTVEPGKLANLVVLNANPLEDAANLSKISAVVVAGNYYARADLDDIMEQASQAPMAGSH